jgi:hypothetical protein
LLQLCAGDNQKDALWQAAPAHHVGFVEGVWPSWRGGWLTSWSPASPMALSWSTTDIFCSKMVRACAKRGRDVNISETCIRRPVMTTLITASLIAFGLFGYRLLAVAALPAVDFPTIQITATLPGASPETMGASVAGPIERALSVIAGITSLTSTSALGTSSVVIQFDLNRNIDGAALDVQSALTVAARKLPIEMVVPPSFRKVNPADQPVIQFSLVSSTLPVSKVDDYAEITLAQQISQLPGVAQVLVFGAQKFAVRVQVDPVAAASHGIPWKMCAPSLPRAIRTRRSAPSPGSRPRRTRPLTHRRR